MLSDSQYCLSILEQAMAMRRLCLVVGAGASANQGIPTWAALVRRAAEDHGIFRECDIQADVTCRLELEEPVAKRQEIRNELLRRVVLQEGSDLPWILELLLRTELKGVELLRDSLYASCPERWTERPDFTGSSLHRLAVLAILIARISPDSDFHVLTYNVDSLLEEAIAQLGHEAIAIRGGISRAFEPRCCPRVVFLPFAPRTQVFSVRVLHAHGMLERSPCVPDGSGLMMTAADYDDSFDSRGGHSGGDQLRAFAALQCVFFGFSLRDYAVRRFIRFGRSLHPRSDFHHRHVALLRNPVPEVHCLPEAPLKRAVARLEEREVQWLSGLGIARYGGFSYDQQTRFIERLLERARPAFGLSVEPRGRASWLDPRY